MLHASRDAGARCAREDSLDDRNLIGDFSSYEHREAHKNLESVLEATTQTQLTVQISLSPKEELPGACATARATDFDSPPGGRACGAPSHPSFEGDPQRACGSPRTFPLVVFWRSGRAAPRAREAPEWAVLPTPRPAARRAQVCAGVYDTRAGQGPRSSLCASVLSLLLCSFVGAPPAGAFAAPFPDDSSKRSVLSPCLRARAAFHERAGLRTPST